MSAHLLTVIEDRRAAGDPPLELPPAVRVVYVVSGEVEVRGVERCTLGDNHTWHGTGACAVHARTDARLLRWELRSPTARVAPEPPGSTMKLAQAIDAPDAGALMRCDRVDFPPAGIAYTHTHQGPGIRVLLHGRFRVEAEGRSLDLEPGGAWFERGPDAVYAEASPDAPAAFVRVMVLPIALLGKSSIRYVKDEDLARPKSQRYTIFVDAPIRV